MTVYLDSSALFKLAIEEPETAALRAWLAAQTPSFATNVIGVVELQRAVRRAGHEAAGARVLATVAQVDLSATAIVRAATLPPPEVRSLDALHIASAEEIADLVAIVTYDGRMAAAATAVGLPVASPA